MHYFTTLYEESIHGDQNADIYFFNFRGNFGKCIPTFTIFSLVNNKYMGHEQAYTYHYIRHLTSPIFSDRST